MKRFLVFAYDTYYPRGGWTDFRSAHDTLEEAKAAAIALDAKPQDVSLTGRWDCIEIADVQQLEMVWSRE